MVFAFDAELWIWDARRGGYVLPIKRAVRRAEALSPEDTATVTVELIDY